ncbi:MAG: BrnT family toxin [Chloroflexota bacterium]|nr:BrnT family toxin [Chloroflexota bacterium]
MRIEFLEWDENRLEHIALHDVEPEEVWEVCVDRQHRAHREGKDRYRVYGQTIDGRYLFIVLERISGNLFKPITARDMTANEKRNYHKLVK